MRVTLRSRCRPMSTCPIRVMASIPVLALVSAALFAAGGCETVTNDRDIQRVSVNEAQALTESKGFALSRSKTLAYVDPRTAKDFAAGHVPGAVLVPMGDLRMGATSQLEDYDVLVVYDTDYDDVVARAVSKRLIELDRWEVYTLTGGLKAWEKSGNEVAYGLPAESGPAEGVVVEAAAKPGYGSAKSSTLRTGK